MSFDLNRDGLTIISELTDMRKSLTNDLKKLYKERIEQLEKEVAHWKANHDNQVKKARILLERKALPIERIEAYSLLVGLPIPIENAKKELYKDVLLLTKDGWVIGDWNGDDWVIGVADNGFEIAQPTHYLPLPPTPKKEI